MHVQTPVDFVIVTGPPVLYWCVRRRVIEGRRVVVKVDAGREPLWIV